MNPQRAAAQDSDLADLVYSHMAEITTDSAVCGFTVHRNKTAVAVAVCSRAAAR